MTVDVESEVEVNEGERETKCREVVMAEASSEISKKVLISSFFRSSNKCPFSKDKKIAKERESQEATDKEKVK